MKNSVKKHMYKIWEKERYMRIAIYMSLALLFISIANPSFVAVINAQGPKQTIKIAFFQPRTAPALNFYGTWAIQGFHLGLEYATGDRKPENLALLMDLKEASYNLPDGRKIIVKVFDTRGSPDVAVAKAREAIEEWKADILAGESFSSVAVALASIAKQYGKLYFVVPAAAASITQDPIFNKYVFRVARNVEQDALAMVYYMVEIQGYRKFAFLAADYEFGWSFMESIQAALSRYTGTRIVALEWAPLTTTDFKPYLLRINASKPDVIGIIWAGDFSLIIRDMAALNILGRIPLASIMIDLYTTNYINFCIPGMQGSLENLTVVTYDAYRASPSPLYNILERMMKEENIYPYDFLRGHQCKALDKLSSARVPDLWHPPAFATAQFIVEAIKAVPDLNTDRMIAFLEGLTLETPMGTTTIRPEDHQALRPYYIVKMVVDSDPGSDTYGLVIGRYIETIPIQKIIPRILTTYKPYPKNLSISIRAPIAGTAPFTATISALIEGGTPPYICEWIIGRATLNGTSISYTFIEPGIYNITLRCRDSIGLKAEANSQIAIVGPGAIQTPTMTQPITITISTVTPAGGLDTTLITAIAIASIAIVVAAISIAILMRRKLR
ncbi:MAG: ABC transporter substrate-binding protein [Sulfolobales archaeon]